MNFKAEKFIHKSSCFGCVRDYFCTEVVASVISFTISCECHPELKIRISLEVFHLVRTLCWLLFTLITVCARVQMCGAPQRTYTSKLPLNTRATQEGYWKDIFGLLIYWSNHNLGTGFFSNTAMQIILKIIRECLHRPLILFNKIVN